MGRVCSKYGRFVVDELNRVHDSGLQVMGRNGIRWVGVAVDGSEVRLMSRV